MKPKLTVRQAVKAIQNCILNGNLKELYAPIDGKCMERFAYDYEELPGCCGVIVLHSLNDPNLDTEVSPFEHMCFGLCVAKMNTQIILTDIKGCQSTWVEKYCTTIGKSFLNPKTKNRLQIWSLPIGSGVSIIKSALATIKTKPQLYTFLHTIRQNWPHDTYLNIAAVVSAASTGKDNKRNLHLTPNEIMNLIK
jgi:hypothetical protein